MTKLFFPIVLMVLVTIGCKKLDKDGLTDVKPKTNISNPKDNSPFTSKDIDIDSIVALHNALANQHNVILDYIYDRVAQKVDSAGQNPLRGIECQSLADIFAEYMVDSLSATSIDFSDMGFADSILSSPGSSNTSTSNHIYRTSGDTLSPGLRNALAQLDLLVFDSLKNKTSSLYDTLIRRYVYPSSYNNTGVTSLTDYEKGVYTASVYIGKNSIQYWSDNHEKWDTLLFKIQNGTGKTYSHQLTQRTWWENVLVEMGQADMGGSIAGGIRWAAACAAGGTVVLPGLGTVAGGAICGLISTLGAAVVSSASAGFWGVIWHYLN